MVLTRAAEHSGRNASSPYTSWSETETTAFVGMVRVAVSPDTCA